MFKEAKTIFLAVLLCCSSASYADMNPLHAPGNRFTHVLGVDLVEDRLDQIQDKLGGSPVTWTGDASTSNGMTCYLLGDGATTIEFDEGEVYTGCTVRKRKKDDSARCTPLKHQKANDHVEINGLKLGISRDEVLKILEKPTRKSSNEWTYDFQGHANDDKGQYYDWQFLITVTFERAIVSQLDLTVSTQNQRYNHRQAS